MVPVCDFFSYFYGSVLLANQANLANQVTSKSFKFKLLQYEKYKNQTIKKQGSGCVLARMNRRGVRGRAQRLMLNC